MFKSFLLITLILGVVFSSCEEATPKNINSSPDTEEQSFSEVELANFNDKIVACIDTSELLMAELMDLDQQNQTADIIVNAASIANQKISNHLETLSKLDGLGDEGKIFKQSAIVHIKNVQEIIEIYLDFAPSLHIPDSLWSNEQILDWEETAVPAFQAYEKSFEMLDASQSKFAAKNQVNIIPSEVTLEELKDSVSLKSEL